MTLVSIVECTSYDIETVRNRVETVLAPLGGMDRFVRPGTRVLIKPNLVAAAGHDQAVTTHPALVRAVAELVLASGGTPIIGDSPGGQLKNGPRVYRKSGMVDAASESGAQLVHFEEVAWKRFREEDYFISKAVFDVDLVISLPKLKTHVLTLYTGAVKNLFGVIPGTRKREAHYRAPGVREFSQVLVDVLEVVRPGLAIMDGVLGQEGDGPGIGGTPRQYNCLAASSDSVALDAVLASAMGYRRGEVLHLVEAAARGLGQADPEGVRVEGDLRALDLGKLKLPRSFWQPLIPGWLSAPLRWASRIRPRLGDAECIACKRCMEVCPVQAITVEGQASFDMDVCVGCLCCAEVCPQGAIEVRRGVLANLSNIAR